MSAKSIIEITCDGKGCSQKRINSALGWHRISVLEYMTPQGQGFQLPNNEAVHFCSGQCLFSWIEKTTGISVA